MRLPLANATIVQVAEPGFTQDADRDDGGTTPTWTGSLGAYIEERSELVAVDGETVTLNRYTVLMVPSEVGTIEAGDQISFTLSFGQFTREVESVGPPYMLGTKTLALELRLATG